MVSSLHSSVLGTTVPGVSSISSVSSSTSSTSSATSTSTSSYDSVSISSTGKMMAAEGSHPPDFDSMSTEEFREHLIELQEKMAESGVDISSFTDPTTMSDEDLNALKDEMSSMGQGGPNGKKGPPPPPPPSEMTSTTETTDSLDLLLEALEEDEEEEDLTTQLLNTLLGNS